MSLHPRTLRPDGCGAPFLIDFLVYNFPTLGPMSREPWAVTEWTTEHQQSAKIEWLNDPPTQATQRVIAFAVRCNAMRWVLHHPTTATVACVQQVASCRDKMVIKKRNNVGRLPVAFKYSRAPFALNKEKRKEINPWSFCSLFSLSSRKEEE